jgi:putative transposase
LQGNSGNFTLRRNSRIIIRKLSIWKLVFHELSRQKNCQILEGHLMPDHVYMCISIPPKYLVAQVIGYIKGKSAIAVARQFSGKNRNFNDESL